MVQDRAAYIDENGIDPLRDPIFDTVDRSVNKTIEIDSAFDGNPQRIAHKHYGTAEKFYLILIANALVHPSELTAGTINIPQEPRKTRERKVRTVTL